ncbi:MAG: stage sporulation protein [Thermoanaerobacter sp.]|jgi:stage III sporulation protein AB|nr:stage sporulation protein [Thermoanaerobacter sp.]
MLKILGSVLILLAGGGMGVTMAGYYARRPQELRSLQAALKMLETEITYTATPLPEALGRVAERAGPRVALLFNRAREELMSPAGCTAREAWEEALKAFYPTSALAPSDLAVLRQLGPALGISSMEDQSKHLRLAMEQLGREMAQAEEKASRYVKLWNYLGFLGGLALILMLY